VAVPALPEGDCASALPARPTDVTNTASSFFIIIFLISNVEMKEAPTRTDARRRRQPTLGFSAIRPQT
jgi:hypothetical protein